MIGQVQLVWGNIFSLLCHRTTSGLIKKLNYIKDAAPTSGIEDDYTYVYGALTNVDVEFTSEELTAFFNENRPSYYALKNVQIKIPCQERRVEYFLMQVV